MSKKRHFWHTFRDERLNEIFIKNRKLQSLNKKRKNPKGLLHYGALLWRTSSSVPRVSIPGRGRKKRKKVICVCVHVVYVVWVSLLCKLRVVVLHCVLCVAFCVMRVARCVCCVVLCCVLRDVYEGGKEEGGKGRKKRGRGEEGKKKTCLPCVHTQSQ
jgi:hypothetical protein